MRARAKYTFAWTGDSVSVVKQGNHMGTESARIERNRQTLAASSERPGPSKLLMSAALSGLVGLSGACDDDDPIPEDDPKPHDGDAGSAHCAPEAGSGGTGHAGADASVDSESIDKELSVKDIQHTFAELKSMCDERKGYVEILGSCSGVNTCQGFTYGDWGADAQLMEHTCAGANGCAGLSCVIPKREGATRDMTGEEIIKLDDTWYEERGGAYGPKACRQCHIESEHNEETGDYDYDYTKLRMPVMPDSGRNANNWTERTAAYQESIVAFGLTHISEKDGTVFTSMASYSKLLSKEEIRRVVEYMRAYKPENVTIKELVLEPGKKAE